jgi:hypothetical protein
MTEPNAEIPPQVPELSQEAREEARRIAAQVNRGDFSGLPTWEEVAAELDIPL